MHAPHRRRDPAPSARRRSPCFRDRGIRCRLDRFGARCRGQQCRHRLECRCRSSRSRRLPVACQRPAPRSAACTRSPTSRSTTRVNAIDRRYEPYTYDVQAPAGSSEAAAVAAAARSALVVVLLDLPSELFPPACGAAGIATVEAAYTAALAAIPDGDAKSQGVAVGEAAAAAIVALRSDDHANDAPLVDVDYPQGTEPGEYKFTPGFEFALAAQVGFGDAVRARRQLAVRERSAIPVGQQALRRRLQRGQGARRPRRQRHERPSRPRSPSSGSRARRWRGTGWRGPSWSGVASTSGRAHACSGC